MILAGPRIVFGPGVRLCVWCGLFRVCVFWEIEFHISDFCSVLGMQTWPGLHFVSCSGITGEHDHNPAKCAYTKQEME